MISKATCDNHCSQDLTCSRVRGYVTLWHRNSISVYIFEVFSAALSVDVDLTCLFHVILSILVSYSFFLSAGRHLVIQQFFRDILVPLPGMVLCPAAWDSEFVLLLTTFHGGFGGWRPAGASTEADPAWPALVVGGFNPLCSLDFRRCKTYSPCSAGLQPYGS